MERIKYETNEKTHCVIPCPYLPYVKVNSYSCNMCPHFKGDNSKKNWILCSYVKSNKTKDAR